MSIVRSETPGGVIVRENSDTTISASITEVTLFTDTISAALLGEGKTIKIRGHCTISTGATPGTLTMTLYLGSAFVRLVQGAALAASATSKKLFFEAEIINKGSKSVQLNNTLLYHIIGETALTNTNPVIMNSNTMAIDTDVNQTFSFTTQLTSTDTTFVLNRLEYRID